MGVGRGCTLTPFPYIYHHVQSCSVRSSRVGRYTVHTQGVGPSTTLAWSGWKQPDIAVEVDTARLETSRFKKFTLNCVLLYYPSTEFMGAFTVY